VSDGFIAAPSSTVFHDEEGGVSNHVAECAPPAPSGEVTIKIDVPAGCQTVELGAEQLVALMVNAGILQVKGAEESLGGGPGVAENLFENENGPSRLECTAQEYLGVQGDELRAFDTAAVNDWSGLLCLSDDD
jgi:hypothetical protein